MDNQEDLQQSEQSLSQHELDSPCKRKYIDFEASMDKRPSVVCSKITEESYESSDTHTLTSQQMVLSASEMVRSVDVMDSVTAKTED